MGDLLVPFVMGASTMQRGREHVKNRKEHGPFGAVGEMMLDAGCWILDFGFWILDFRPPGWRSQKRVILGGAILCIVWCPAL